MRRLGYLLLFCGLAPGVRGEGWVKLAQADFPLHITQPGNYRLTENIKQTGPSAALAENGITIEAGNVTLDLGGFVLAGSYTTTVHGIYADGLENLVIQNGSVVGWGEDGINTLTSSNCLFRNLRSLRNHDNGLESGVMSVVIDCVGSENGIGQLAANDVDGNGVIVGQSSIVIDSRMHGNHNHGVDTSSGVEVVGCVASHNGHDPFHTGQANVISHCTGWNNPPGDTEINIGTVVFECTFHLDDDGLKARDEGSALEGRCVFHRCTSVSNKDGFSGETASLFAFCNAHDNKDDGFVGNEYCLFYRCMASRNGFVDSGTPGGGINFDGGHNMAIGNHLIGNEHGITSSNQPATGIKNIVVANSARGNTMGQYSLKTTDYRGPYTNSATGVSAWVNFRL